MINQALHKQAVAADRAEHRYVRMKVPVADWSVADKVNSMFVAATEFGDAAREYPLVFVRAGTDDDGKPAIAPIAVFGVKPEQNLYVERGRWRVPYLPALLRAYPFCIGRIDAERFAVCFDAAWSGVGGSEGQRLFDDQGDPTPFLTEVRAQMETLEAEIQRTRAMCRRLRDLDLLREMRFDATLPDGSKLSVDGFLTVDEAKLDALPDAQVLELHRSGLLGLVHAHFVSLGGMRRLLDWHLERLPRPAPAA
jgi:SapC